jgi:DNA-binding CsgD family transcriptional regulator/hemerythrin
LRLPGTHAPAFALRCTYFHIPAYGAPAGLSSPRGVILAGNITDRLRGARFPPSHARPAMKIKLTGHAEIDQQHSILESSMGSLAVFCSGSPRYPDVSCEHCSAYKRQCCDRELASLSRELTAFLVGHTTYEERLMELLPPTPRCQEHIRRHKLAHARIAGQLHSLSTQTTRRNPAAMRERIIAIVMDWLGSHTSLADDGSVSRLGHATSPEIDFDGELVAILDEHVFHNRPVKGKVSARAEAKFEKGRLENRRRFESLSPAQRAVFWLVVDGKRNADIAKSLGISVNTIKTHRSAMFQKMEVRSALELAKRADWLR